LNGNAMKKLLFWIVIVVLVISGSILYIQRPWKTAAPINPNSQPKTARAFYQDIEATVLATGKIMPQVGAEVNVGARISGRLEHLHVNVGDTVVKGQIIAEIEKEDLEAVLSEEKADIALIQTRLNTLRATAPREIARAEAQLAERRASLKFADSEIKRQEQLLDKGAVGKQAWDQAVKQVEITQAQTDVAEKDLQLAKTNFTEGIKQIEAELVKARASLKNAQVKLTYAIIRAPINGIVASVSTREGETVAAGLSAPTFVTILDLERLQLEASVDEVDIGRVMPGQIGFFTVDTFPDKEFKSRVTAIKPQAVIQDNVVSYICVMAIETPYAGLLRPQMTANVTIVVEKRDHVLVLPLKAVKHRKGKSIVYKKNGTDIVTTIVTTGWQDGNLIEILSGLSEGDGVLLSPPVI
jgi:HlyD family secretion protein